jgi:HK97 family phage prohead protease
MPKPKNLSPADELRKWTDAEGGLTRYLADIDAAILATGGHGDNDLAKAKEDVGAKLAAVSKVLRGLRAGHSLDEIRIKHEGIQAVLDSIDVKSILGGDNKHMLPSVRAAFETVMQDWRETFGTVPDATGTRITGYGIVWGVPAETAKGTTIWDKRAFGTEPIRGTLQWQHDDTQPIGTFIATPDDHGMKVVADVIESTQRGREAIALIRSGALTGLSPGFQPLRSHPGPGKIARVIDQAKLSEFSIVTHPANPAARVHIVDGDQVPQQFHADDMTDVERTIAEAQAWLDGERSQSKAPDVLDFDFFRGRVRTPEEAIEQHRSARLEKLYRLLSKDPGAARLPVEVLNTLLDIEAIG